MTTKVTIGSPPGNHQNVRVEGRYLMGDQLGRLVPHMGVEPYYVETLTDGQSTTLWVHDGACVVIREVAKLRETGKVLQPDELPAPGEARRLDVHEDRPIITEGDLAELSVTGEGS